MITGILPTPDRKFFISWMACFLAMYSVSYVWHGVVLNDFLKMSYPIHVLLTVSAIVYFGIALLITVLTYALKRIKDSFKYGIAIGAVVGTFMYAIAFLLGIRFNVVMDVKLILFDLAWQVFEQGFGGLVCGYVYRMFYLREKHMSH